GTVLNADPTLQYAAGTPAEWWPTLGDADLAADTPYNTYIYPGLPPGPISNPGVASIQAVANPADVDFQYFVALNDGTGGHAFAVTYEEHQQNVCTYNPPACEGAGLPPSLAEAPVTDERRLFV
ncbi:MAG: endolytic transglycosylase MltG, partial [Chloroflexota bacterium]|nr:endolytic transglycosylase MltG [Chloroflexota bacterium]